MVEKQRGFLAAAVGLAWVLALSAFGVAGSAVAETLHTTPPGARVEFRGQLTLSGAAPIPLDDLPAGRYRLTLEGKGLPSVRARLLRAPGGRMVLTRQEGLSSFLLPPGPAHWRNGERARGILLFAAGLGFGGAALIQESTRSNASGDLDRALVTYGDAVSTAGIAAARLEVRRAALRADDGAELRDLWTAMAAAVWVGSALESWLLTPVPRLRYDGTGEVVLSAAPASGFGAAVRSVIVPGAGQRYMGHAARGNRFTAAMALLGAATITVHGAYLKKRRDQVLAQERYDLAATDVEASRLRRTLEDAASSARDMDRARNIVFGATAALYLWNILDAAHLAAEETLPAGMSWRVQPRADGIRAGLAWRID